MLYYSPFDIYYIALVLPAALFALFCQFRVTSTFKKYARIRTRRGITGEQAAARVCALGEARHVSVKAIAGNLTDHFNPKDNVISLSQSVYGESSVAAVGVAAHEAGHAAQYAQGYGPVKLRAGILPVTRVASMLALPLILIGFAVEGMPVLVNIGILLFGVAFLFQLLTLPVEFDASRRALAILESGGMLDGDELRGAKRVLSAAAMTYVAAMAVSLMQLIRVILLAQSRGRRR
ncbi:MAG: zinc metallopeptidase [Oscillospiraceae bacterium]|jgi:Zn-dependent membrane protease YugP|nr:zinc metallopeptidase [Oscillospiraceae bacterium]